MANRLQKLHVISKILIFKRKQFINYKTLPAFHQVSRYYYTGVIIKALSAANEATKNCYLEVIHLDVEIGHALKSFQSYINA